jgi:hypothetical protein
MKSRSSRDHTGDELEGLGFSLCAAPSRIAVSQISEHGDDRSWLRQELFKKTRGQDDGKPKLIFKLQKHTDEAVPK